MAPSGVQKERMRPEDMFVLSLKGAILETPEVRPPPYKAPKLSECSPLFMLVRPSCAPRPAADYSANSLQPTGLQPSR
jgi:Class II Aldolase and Adducin N-terminal domain